MFSRIRIDNFIQKETGFINSAILNAYWHLTSKHAPKRHQPVQDATRSIGMLEAGLSGMNRLISSNGDLNMVTKNAQLSDIQI